MVGTVGIHQSQVLSYLKTMDLRLALLMNFSGQLFKEGIGAWCADHRPCRRRVTTSTKHEDHKGNT